MSKKASTVATMSLLAILAAALAIVAMVRANNELADSVSRAGAKAPAAVSNTGLAVAASRQGDLGAAEVQPVHAVARSADPVASDTQIIDPTSSDPRNNDANSSGSQNGSQTSSGSQPATHTFTADEVAYYLSADETVFIRPGLNVTIQNVTIPADRKPVVTFLLTDAQGQPLDRLGVLTPATVSTSFILAYLPPTTKGEVTDYVAYTTRTQTSPITGVKAIQAGTDSGGTYTPSGLNDGVYTYKFATVLPSGYNTAATHTLGIYATRNLTEFGLTLYVSDVTKDFVPNGAAVTQVHQVVPTANCNQCHDPLAAHGSTGRRAVEICILCHNPQTIDPDTGNTVDMKVMIHKIHMGSSLPSVIAGTPYIIIGNAQAVQDFSTVSLPQDIRNCQTCHSGASQVNAWNLQPSMEACGSCHDDINWATGANHPGGVATDNSKCASCHLPQGTFEFDASVIGAHTVPYKSKQLLNPKVNIISVTNTAPGQHPILKFTFTDKNNNLLAPSLFTGTGRLSLNFGGPTTDYTTTKSETVSSMPAYVNGVATYTATYTIPANAIGTWVLETEARLQTNLIINGDPKNLSASQRDAALNTLTYFAVTDKTPVARRTVVSIDQCNKCHDQLGKASAALQTGGYTFASFHGGGRNQIVCGICHNPSFVASTTPISFQILVHRIHTGDNLSGPYVVGGTDFSDVRYPGDRRDCTACHAGTSYQVPLPATNIAVTTPNWYWTPTLPTAAACLACHDAASSAAHAFINTTVLPNGSLTVESCEVCHKEAADFAVTKVHAR